MSVRTTDPHYVAMYDSTSGRAFGPIFDSEEDAASFLDWLRDKAMNNEKFKYGNETLLYLDDPRTYRADELDFIHRIWKEATSVHD